MNNAIVINKIGSKIQIFCVLVFALFSFKFVETISSIILLHIIIESSIILANYFPFSQLHVAGFQTQSFSHTWRFLHSHRHLSLFHDWSELQFLPSNLHLHSHDICFVNIFHSFILVIMLNTLRFKSSVLFGTRTLLDKSLRVLQLLANQSNLTENGY